MHTPTCTPMRVSEIVASLHIRHIHGWEPALWPPTFPDRKFCFSAPSRTSIQRCPLGLLVAALLWCWPLAPEWSSRACIFSWCSCGLEAPAPPAAFLLCQGCVCSGLTSVCLSCHHERLFTSCSPAASHFSFLRSSRLHKLLSAGRGMRCLADSFQHELQICQNQTIKGKSLKSKRNLRC